MNDNAYRCSTPTTSRKHDHALDNILLTNGYPENVIFKTKRPRRRQHQPQQQQSNKDWLYFEILFISDRLDRKITKIFRKENIDTRITHRVYTLRNALSTKRNEPQCKRTNCPVASRQFAFVETPSTRSHDRVKEHLKNNKSSVFKHKNAKIKLTLSSKYYKN